MIALLPRRPSTGDASKRAVIVARGSFGLDKFDPAFPLEPLPNDEGLGLCATREVFAAPWNRAAAAPR